MIIDVLEHTFHLCLFDEVNEPDLGVAASWKLVNKDCNRMVRRHLQLQSFRYRDIEYFVTLSDCHAMRYEDKGWTRIRYSLRPNIYFRVGTGPLVRYSVVSKNRENRTPISGELWNSIK